MLDTSRILQKGPEYLRKQMEREREAPGRSAAERLAATKPEYIRNQQPTAASETVSDIGSPDQSEPTPSSPPNTVEENPSNEGNVVKRNSSKKRPDSLLLYRHKGELQRGSPGGNGKKLTRRTLLSSRKDKTTLFPRQEIEESDYEASSGQRLTNEANGSELGHEDVARKQTTGVTDNQEDTARKPTTVVTGNREDVARKRTMAVASNREDAARKPTTVVASNREECARKPTLTVAGNREDVARKPTTVVTSNQEECARKPTMTVASNREDVARKLTTAIPSSREDAARKPTTANASDLQDAATSPTTAGRGERSRRRSRVSRSHSDISSRYSKSFADFDIFFTYCGLDADVIESVGRENFCSCSETPEEVFIGSGKVRSVSVVTSDGGFSQSSSNRSDRLQGDELPDKNTGQGPSVIERNARIIKWLYSCRNAAQSGKTLRDLE
ncbi:uncharacterized protein fam110c [Salminus brasiliensis]|uniref:uncharacterized protein fam110c n=1 Tax=Salminus brasiliensis TaxID=930266 RepID=UPI003B82DDC2